MTQVDDMLPPREAWRTIADCVNPLSTRRVPLADAVGCVLAEDLRADCDYPPFDRAMMDGFAVRSSDCDSVPSQLEIAGELAAGDSPLLQLAGGHAARINTGAAVPPGADAVVMIERTRISRDGRRVLVDQSARPELNIARKGSDRTAGQVVLKCGQRLGEAQIAVAATIGADDVLIRPRPAVAVLATGSELVDEGQTTRSGQIRNSNGPSLTALGRRIGCDCLDLGTVPDDPKQIRRRIAEGLVSDVLCLTGGVSMGQYDLVPDVLESLEVRIHLHKVAIKPGKPTLFGSTEDGHYVFGLPGNPVSCIVVFLIFVEPTLARLEGLAAEPPRPILARLTGVVGRTKGRYTYFPARWRVEEDGVLTAEPVEYHGSADVFGLAEANGLIFRPPRAGQAGPGDSVLMIPFWWQR